MTDLETADDVVVVTTKPAPKNQIRTEDTATVCGDRRE